MTKEDRDRYIRAMHAVQSGVAMSMERAAHHGGDSETSPKHLRVGINAAMVDTAAVAKLLMAKGVFTMDEYEKAIADQAEEEARSYEMQLSRLYGTKVTLG